MTRGSEQPWSDRVLQVSERIVAARNAPTGLP